MKGFVRFNKGLMRMPLPVQIWVMLLLAANVIGPLFFLGRVEAQVVLAVMAVNALLMGLLTGWFGFTRLLGAGHFLWIPMLGWLWMRLDGIPPDDAFGIWLRSVMIVNAISLVMDVADVVRYAIGDRNEVVEGL